MITEIARQSAKISLDGAVSFMVDWSTACQLQQKKNQHGGALASPRGVYVVRFAIQSEVTLI